jgi:hypothetical protein
MLVLLAIFVYLMVQSMRPSLRVHGQFGGYGGPLILMIIILMFARGL